MIIFDDQNGPLTKSGDDVTAIAVNRNVTRSTTHSSDEQAPQHRDYNQSARPPNEQPPPPYTLRSSSPSDPLLFRGFHRELGKRARKRFIHALAFAVLFWSVTGILARGIFITALRSNKVC